jgi:hypothetical protein
MSAPPRTWTGWTIDGRPVCVEELVARLTPECLRGRSRANLALAIFESTPRGETIVLGPDGRP